jgi:hypothetical protein
VANHTLLALDVFTGVSVLPERDAVVLDEAHEFVESVTDALSHELALGDVRRAVAAVTDLVSEATLLRLEAARDGLEGVLQLVEPGWVRALDRHSLDVLGTLETAAAAASAEITRELASSELAGEDVELARLERARSSWQALAEAAREIGTPSVASAVYAVADGRAPAAGLAAARRRRAGQPAVRRHHRGGDLGDPVARRVVPARRGPARAHLAGRLSRGRCRGGARRSRPGRGRRGAGRRPGRTAAALEAPRRRQPVRLPLAVPAVDRPRPAGPRPDGGVVGEGGGRAAGRAGHRRRWTHARPVQLHRCSGAGRRCGARGDRPADPAAGRRLPRRAAAPLRLRRPDLPVRHAVVLAGRGHPRQRLPAGGHRPHPVRAPRRPAVQGPAWPRPGRRPQRLPGGHPAACRGAARPGRRAG